MLEFRYECLQRRGFKLRTRYKIGEKGKFFVDPLLYFEYIQDDNFSKPNVGEVKLVLTKDIGDFNVSYNQIVKRNLERKGKTDHEYAAGVSYALTPRLRVGFESSRRVVLMCNCKKDGQV